MVESTSSRNAPLKTEWRAGRGGIRYSRAPMDRRLDSMGSATVQADSKAVATAHMGYDMAEERNGVTLAV